MKFSVKDNVIAVEMTEHLVSGSVKVYRAEFTFDETWDGYTKTAVFWSVVGGKEYKQEMLLIGDSCYVPYECLIAGALLRVGVYGLRGETVRPTIYTPTPGVHIDPGAEPSEPGSEPTPSVYQQILALIEAGKVKGDPGITPHIGENGNWWIGDADTGVHAQGPAGEDGVGAYEQAVAGGYEGTEDEFRLILKNAATTEYVDRAISTAIGNAIEGEY